MRRKADDGSERYLSIKMECDHVVFIQNDGSILEQRYHTLEGFWPVSRPVFQNWPYAPESYIDGDEDGQILAKHEKDWREGIERAGWEVLDGWSGQYKYSGPIMHASEYIGGDLADHIRETPGYWVWTTVEFIGNSEPAGWVLCHREK